MRWYGGGWFRFRRGFPAASKSEKRGPPRERRPFAPKKDGMVSLSAPALPPRPGPAGPPTFTPRRPRRRSSHHGDQSPAWSFAEDSDDVPRAFAPQTADAIQRRAYLLCDAAWAGECGGPALDVVTRRRQTPTYGFPYRRQTRFPVSPKL